MASIDEKIQVINEFIAKGLWLDFEIKSFDGFTLIIIGGIDLIYGWQIELTFFDTSFLSAKSDWKRNDHIKAIEILDGDNAKSTNIRYLIEDGNYLFAFNHEDLNEDKSNQYIIASKNIDYKIANVQKT